MIQSLRPSDFAPAFGRAVAASRRLKRPKAKALGYLEATATIRAGWDGALDHSIL
jgi:hypothetical protein